MSTDPALLSDRTLHIEERAEQHYQQRKRHRYEEIISDHQELRDLITDYLPLLIPPLTALTNDCDPDHVVELHRIIHQQARYLADRETPSRIDEDYE